MFCKQCGTENKESAKFCEKCGTPLNSEDAASDISDEKSCGDAGQGNSSGEQAAASSASVSEHSRKKKARIGAVIILAAAVICIVGLMVYHNQQQAADYRGKLQTAGKYIEEMDYSKAEAAYLEAIKIQPKKEDAYLKLADTYVAQKKYDKAIKVLNTGKKKTSSKKIEKKIKSVQKEKKAKVSGMSDQQYTAYYDLCKDYMDKYGEPGYEPLDYDSEHYDMTGLSVVKLFDFDNNGTQELVLCYDTGLNKFPRCFYEVWAWDKGELKQVLEATPVNHTNGDGLWLESTIDKGVRYLINNFDNASNESSTEGSIMSEGTRYLQFTNGSFKEAFVWEWYMLDDGSEIQKVNNKEVSSYDEAEKRVPTRVQEDNAYGYETELSYESGKDSFCTCIAYLPESYAKALLEDTRKTLDELCLDDAQEPKEEKELNKEKEAPKEPEVKTVEELQLMTLTGILTKEDYEINENNKGTATMLILDEPITIRKQEEDGELSEPITMEKIQIGFNEDSGNHHYEQKVSVMGEVMFAYTGHHITPILLMHATETTQ